MEDRQAFPWHPSRKITRQTTCMTDKPSLGNHLEIPQDRLHVEWTKPSPSTPLRVTRGQTMCMTDMPSPAHLSECQRTDYLTGQTSLPLAIILSAKLYVWYCVGLGLPSEALK